MLDNGRIYMGIADTPQSERVYMNLSQSNRHGLIAGASGTGKTVTMKVMAESFSAAGVPVFMCDVKGDVSGMAEAGLDNAGMRERIAKFGIEDSFSYKAYPVEFWDVYGMGGHSVRVTVSDMGSDILSCVLELTEAQQGVLDIIFRIADDSGLKILDMKDLKAVISHVSEKRTEYSAKYGNMAAQSIGAVSRALIRLEDEGADRFFGEPMLDIHDWIRTSPDGRGVVNILDCTEIIKHPKLYAAFLLWMLAELFENLPEAGDSDKPKLVFFFDEAHLLFSEMPRALIYKIEQTVKLVRSKGVGVYFVTQSPSDIPDPVLAQLSNRVQHALRAYTPAEMKAVKTAAASFRPNPAFKAEDEIMTLGCGEALTSFLDEDGVPEIVQKTKIICPESKMSSCSPVAKAAAISNSQMTKYDKAVDSESAYEVLLEKGKKEAELEEIRRQREELEEERGKLEAAEEKARLAEEKRLAKEEEKARAAREKKAEKRRDKIESQLIQAGGQILKRGLLGILKLK